MASDGVFDNVYMDNSDIDLCVKPEMEGVALKNPTGVSECFAKLAYQLGYEQNYLSPFSKHAREQGKPGYPAQGKADDIAIITA